MNLIRNILGRAFALWAMIIFAGSLLIVAIPIWITAVWQEPKRTINAFYIFRAWMNFFFLFSGVRRVIKGREHFKKGENYVVVCNHNSFMDVPLSTPAIPGPNKTIAKAELAKIPLFGLIYKRGSILVDRSDKKSRQNSFRKMQTVLQMGMHMCIYPEGTRNKTLRPLKEFHDGAFRLAIETGTAIIPALIFNTRKVLPADQFYFWPAKIELHFLAPVYINTDENYQLIKEKIHRLMSDYYESNLKQI